MNQEKIEELKTPLETPLQKIPPLDDDLRDSEANLTANIFGSPGQAEEIGFNLGSFFAGANKNTGSMGGPRVVEVAVGGLPSVVFSELSAQTCGQLDDPPLASSPEENKQGYALQKMEEMLETPVAPQNQVIELDIFQSCKQAQPTSNADAQEEDPQWLKEVKQYLKNLYTNGTAEAPTDPYARKIIQHFLKVVGGVPSEDLKAGIIRGIPKLKSKRHDQYVKKFHSKWANSYYSTLKTKYKTKEEVVKMLKKDHNIGPNENSSFHKLILGGKKHGLAKDAVKLLLSNESLWNKLMTKEHLLGIMKGLKEETDSDINTNIISKLEPDGESKDSNMEEIVEGFKSKFAKKKGLKLPFSYSHNLESAVHFLTHILEFANEDKRDEIEGLMKNLKDWFKPQELRIIKVLHFP